MPRVTSVFDPVRDTQKHSRDTQMNSNSTPPSSPWMGTSEVPEKEHSRATFKRLRIEDLLGPSEDYSSVASSGSNEKKQARVRAQPSIKQEVDELEFPRGAPPSLPNFPTARCMTSPYSSPRSITYPSSLQRSSSYNENQKAQSSRTTLNTWTSAAHAQTRIQFSSEDIDAAHFAALLSTKETKQRQQYPREFRVQAILYTKIRTGMPYDPSMITPSMAQLASLKDPSAPRITKYRAAKIIGITPKMLQDWMDREESILQQKHGQMRGNSGRKAELPDLEEQLYARWENYRDEGRLVSRKWWKSEARSIYETLYPEKVKVENHQGTDRKVYEFKFSRSWLIRFKERYGIEDDESVEFDISEDDEESDRSVG